MDTNIFNFDFRDLKIDIARIERILGCDNSEPRDIIGILLKEVLKGCEDIAGIKAEYRIFDNPGFIENGNIIRIGKSSFNAGAIIFKNLKGSESVALFLCTAGKEISIRGRKAVAEGDFLRGYIYDIVGTETVEAAADLMQDHLERTLKMCEKKITNRYSPGYCGWDVSEQHILFDLMPDNHCGVILTQSALMDPVKSVSGIIGIGSKVHKAVYGCKACGMQECIYRKKRR
jgi:hypothetical protein